MQLRVWFGDYPEPEKKFIILFHSRSGSRLLMSLINSHPEIYCDNEIFLRKRVLFPTKYFVNRSKYYGKKYYGHKAKLFQLERQYIFKQKVRRIFLQEADKIIYLLRRNYLRQAISQIISKQRNQWHDTEDSPLAGKKFVIDLNSLKKCLEWIELSEKREKEALEGLDYLFLCYEDDLLDVANHQKTLDKVFEYLGVDIVQVSTDYVRTTPDDLSDIIENYDELVKGIMKTKYSVFF